MLRDCQEWNHGKTPHTDPKAMPTHKRKVSNACVIRVKHAFYRGSTFCGEFELCNPSNPIKKLSGKDKSEVICCWHNVKPITCYPHITLLDEYEIINDYTGEVIANIGR